MERRLSRENGIIISNGNELFTADSKEKILKRNVNSNTISAGVILSRRRIFVFSFGCQALEFFERVIRKIDRENSFQGSGISVRFTEFHSFSSNVSNVEFEKPSSQKSCVYFFSENRGIILRWKIRQLRVGVHFFSMIAERKIL